MGVVTARQIEFRNPTLPLGPPELDDHIEGLPNVLLDLGKGQRGTDLQHHDRKPINCQFRSLCVDRIDRPAMAGVDRLKIGQGLGAAQLADDDPVWAREE